MKALLFFVGGLFSSLSQAQAIGAVDYPGIWVRCGEYQVGIKLGPGETMAAPALNSPAFMLVRWNTPAPRSMTSSGSVVQSNQLWVLATGTTEGNFVLRRKESGGKVPTIQYYFSRSSDGEETLCSEVKSSYPHFNRVGIAMPPQ